MPSVAEKLKQFIDNHAHELEDIFGEAALVAEAALPAPVANDIAEAMKILADLIPAQTAPAAPVPALPPTPPASAPATTVWTPAVAPGPTPGGSGASAGGAAGGAGSAGA